MFQSPLEHMCSPACTSLKKLGVPFSHPRSVNRNGTGAPLGRNFVMVKSWPGGRAQGPAGWGSGRGVPPGQPRSSCVPRARAGTPPSRPLWDWRGSFHSGLTRKPPNGSPGEGSGTHAVSLGLGGLSPAGSRPLRVWEWEPPMARSSRPDCARLCSSARRADPDPELGGGGGAGGRVGPRGGRGWQGALPQGPRCLESWQKDGAGDYSANCRARPAPRPGTPARGHREAMLMPRSAGARGAAPHLPAREPQGGRGRAAGGVYGKPGRAPRALRPG